MKEIFGIINLIINKLFDMSVRKRNQETDFNIKTLNMMKEYNLSPIFKDMVEARQIKLLTGKNVNICLAEKIQKLKIKLGGNITDKQLYSIISFYKEDENGDLYVDISKVRTFLIKFITVFFIVIFFIVMIKLGIFFKEINTIRSFLYYIFSVILCGITGLIFIYIIGNNLTAIQIKEKLARIPIN
jgi:hypothetical protein